MGTPKNKTKDPKPVKTDSDTSESVYETDAESSENEDKRPRGSNQQEDEDEEDEGIAVVIERCLEWWRKYWQQRFFRQFVRSSIVFFDRDEIVKRIKRFRNNTRCSTSMPPVIYNNYYKFIERILSELNNFVVEEK